MLARFPRDDDAPLIATVTSTSMNINPTANEICVYN